MVSQDRNGGLRQKPMTTFKREVEKGACKKSQVQAIRVVEVKTRHRRSLWGKK